MVAPHDRKYTSDHEWLLATENTLTVGITQYAADALGDVVYVDLPAVGTAVTAGSAAGEIESTKSVGELIAPVTGTVAEINQSVVDTPELINGDPYGEGWLIRISDAVLPDTLLDASEYEALTGE